MSELIEFEVLWYSGGPDYAPNRCIGRTTVRKHDLTTAIKWACNALRDGKHGSVMAHGMYVRRAT